MAISWAEGLLAGAAGVAEYSKEQQEKRQARLDRATELQQQMKLHQAKSKYAVQMNDYEASQKLMKSLEGVEAGSYQEQLQLQLSKGIPIAQATKLATQSVNGKLVKLQRPKALELPEFVVETVGGEVASSPLQDWVLGYRNSKSQALEAPSEVPQDLQAEPTSGISEPQRLTPRPPGTPQADVETVPLSGSTSTSDLEFKEPQGFSGVIPGQVTRNFDDPLAPTPEYGTPQMVETTQNGVKGTIPTYTLKGTNQTVYGKFIPKTDMIKEPEHRTVVREGKEMIEYFKFDDKGKTIVVDTVETGKFPSEAMKPQSRIIERDGKKITEYFRFDSEGKTVVTDEVVMSDGSIKDPAKIKNRTIFNGMGDEVVQYYVHNEDGTTKVVDQVKTGNHKESPWVSVPNVTKIDEQGREVTMVMEVNKDTRKRRQVAKWVSDPNTQRAKPDYLMGNLNTFMAKDVGAFNALFPETQGWGWGEGNLKDRMAELGSNYRTAAIGAFNTTNGIKPEQLRNPDFIEKLENRIKAIAYERTFSHEELVDHIEDGDIPSHIFNDMKFKKSKRGQEFITYMIENNIDPKDVGIEF